MAFLIHHWCSTNQRPLVSAWAREFRMILWCWLPPRPPGHSPIYPPKDSPVLGYLYLVLAWVYFRNILEDFSEESISGTHILDTIWSNVHQRTKWHMGVGVVLLYSRSYACGIRNFIHPTQVSFCPQRELSNIIDPALQAPMTIL